MLTALALLLAGTIPFLPAYFGGHFSRTHEGMRYEHLASLFLDALRHGQLYPRWLPDLTGGFGYPMFVFYQPVVFYCAAAISVATGAGMILAMQLTGLLFAVVGSFGAFAVAREFSVGRIAGVACAILFLITPYAFVNLYVRGDHSEFAAMMLTPWPIACLLKARRRLKSERSQARLTGPLLGAAATLALVIATHPAVAMFFVPLVFILAAIETLFMTRGDRLQWITSVACTGVLTAALSSAYWVPVFQNRPFVQMDDVSSGPYDPLQHTIAAKRLISSEWDYGISGWKTRGIPPSMSVQLGLPHLLLAVAGLIVGFRRPWVLLSAIAYLALIFMMTVYADRLWHRPSPIRIIQFPWRLLSVIAPLQLLLACAAIARFAPRRPHIQGAVALAIVGFAAIYYHAMFRASPRLFDLVDGTKRLLSWQGAQLVLNDGLRTIRKFPEDFSGQGEFMPRWAPSKIPEAREGPALVSEGSLTFSPTTTEYRIDATVEADSAHKVVLQQLYFPGWHVEVNGRPLPFTALKPDAAGRIEFEVPAGRQRVVAYFDGPIYWRARTAISLVLVAASVGAIVFFDRRKARPITPHT